MMEKLKTASILFLILCSTFSCRESEVGKSELSISFSQNKSSNDGRILSEEPAYVMVTIEDISGNEIISDAYGISAFGSEFLVDPILLEVGEYSITKFLVFNENDEVIFATPISGSVLENLVENSLPIAVSISPDVVNELELEVLSTASVDPEDLGYSSTSFTIVPIIDILVSVFDVTDSESSYEFVNSKLTIFADGDSIRTISLGDSINVVRLRSDASEVSLHFDVDTYDRKSYSLTMDSLNYYRTTPLEVIFAESDPLNEGLVAYYPFDGDAVDLSGNEFNGVLGSDNSSPSEGDDRNEVGAAAFSFDGVDDYIDLGERSEFSLGNYASFSVSVWVQPDVSATRGIIVGKYLSASSNRQWVLQIIDAQIAFRVFDNGGQSPVDAVSVDFLDSWQHIVVVYDNNTFNLYQNGDLISSQTKTVTFDTDGSTVKTVVGAAHSSGAGETFDLNYKGGVDELRIYERALSSDDIVALYND